MRSTNPSFWRVTSHLDLDVSENSGTPKSSILIGFSIINHPFWGTPILGNTHLPELGGFYSSLQLFECFPLESWGPTTLNMFFDKTHLSMYVDPRDGLNGIFCRGCHNLETKVTS